MTASIQGTKLSNANRMRAYTLHILILLSCFLSACDPPSARMIVVVGDRSKSRAQISSSVEFGVESKRSELPSLPDSTHLKVRIVDDMGDGFEARRRALEIIADPEVLAVVGHSASGTTLSALDIYGPRQLPVFMPVATDPQITAKSKDQKWNNVFRLVPKHNLQASTIENFIESTLKVKHVIVLHDDTRYGEGLGNSIQAELNNKGVDVIERMRVDFYKPGANDYLSLCDKIISCKAEAVIYAGYYNEGGHLLHDMLAKKIDVPIVFTDGCFQPGLAASIQQGPDKCYISFVAPDWLSMPILNNIATKAKQSKIDLTYAPFASDCLSIIYEASKSVIHKDETLNRQSLLKAMTDKRYFGSDVLAGPYEFDGSGDNIKGRNYMYRAEIVDRRVSWIMIK